MNEYFLSRDVYACKIDDAAVFLDVRSNSYIAVPPAAMAQLDRSVQGFCALGPTPGTCPKLDETEAVQSLVRRGILTPSSLAGKPASRAYVHWTNAMVPGQGRTASWRIKGVQVAKFAGALAQVAASLRFNRLDRVVHSIRRLRACAADANVSSSPERIQELLEAFRRLRTFAYTARDSCLLDASVLAVYLHRCRVTPTFAIGVRTKPFGAHAWVQVGDCVLDDRLETLHNFTPILVI